MYAAPMLGTYGADARSGLDVMRGQLARAMFIWAVLSAVGVAVVAIPDSSAQVINPSVTHGPAAADLLGIVLLLLGWFSSSPLSGVPGEPSGRRLCVPRSPSSLPRG